MRAVLDSATDEARLCPSRGTCLCLKFPFIVSAKHTLPHVIQLDYHLPHVIQLDYQHSTATPFKSIMTRLIQCHANSNKR